MKYFSARFYVNLFWVQGIMSYTLFVNPSVTQLTEPVNIAESPVWDGRVGKLFFVDIHDGKVMAFDYEKHTTDIAAEFPGNDVTPIILTSDPNVIVAGINRDLTKIQLYNSSCKPQVLHTVQNEKPKNRFNEGKADSKGRVWIGTIGHEPRDGPLDAYAAALFKFTKGNLTNPSIMIPNVSISNGLTWSLDESVFYYIDTYSEEIAQYDYDAETGSISNRKIVFSVKERGMGHPDGMTIDNEGNLWVALYAGGSVIQIDPSQGIVMRRIPIPASHTTSVAWGGPNLDILFVTTSKRSLTKAEREQQPGAGSLYAITNLGTKGMPMHEADI